MYSPIKPSFHQYFETDIIQNIKNRTCDLTLPMYLPDLMKECFMYSTDMCIEFQQKSDGLLTSEWIGHITNEVCIVFQKLFPRDFGAIQTELAKAEVENLMRMPNEALRQVNEYYNRL